jgi:hypothetical protein
MTTFHTTNIRWLAIGIDDYLPGPNQVDTFEGLTSGIETVVCWSKTLADGDLYQVTVIGVAHDSAGVVLARFDRGFGASRELGVSTLLGTDNHVEPDGVTVPGAVSLHAEVDIATHVFSLQATSTVAADILWDLRVTWVKTASYS